MFYILKAGFTSKDKPLLLYTVKKIAVFLRYTVILQETFPWHVTYISMTFVNHVTNFVHIVNDYHHTKFYTFFS